MRFAPVALLLAACGGTQITAAAPHDVTAVAGDQSATVSWAGDGAAFVVKASPGGVSVNASASPAHLTGLTNGTAYTFTVSAGGVESQPSAAVTPFGKPLAAANVRAVRGDHGATVTWDAAPANGAAVTSYKVTPSAGAAQTVTALTATFSGLENGTGYTFSVSASNAAGEGPAAVSGAVVPAGVPSAPAITSATGGVRTASVSFTAADGNGADVGAYEVDTQGAVSFNGLTATISGLADATQYSFRVRAVNDVGAGAWSDAAQVSTAATPAKPAAPAATAGDRTATVSWAAPASSAPIVSYTVTASPGGATINTGALATTFNGLTNGTAYSFTVSATNAVGTSATSDASAPVTPAGPPGAASITSVTAGVRSAALQWTAADPNGSAITSYAVQKSTTGGATWTPANATISGLTASVSDLGDGTTYVFRVLATSATGTTSSSPSAAVSTAALPGAPGKPVATAGVRSMQLTWPAASGNGDAVTGYIITSSTGATTTSATTSATINGLDDGASYTFSVSAQNGVGTGPSADSDPMKTLYVPSPPYALGATPAASSASLSWTAPDKGAVTSYAVLQSTDGVNFAQIAPAISGTTATVSGLSSGTTYWFQVYAKNAVGNSQTSDAAQVTIP